MKITDIEGHETLATKADLEELKRELSLQIRELRVEFKEQFQRVRVLIWLPVITGALQIIVLLITRR